MSAGRRLRTLLLLDAAAIAAIMAVALLGLGLPFSARRSLSPAGLGAAVAAAAVVATLLGGWLLSRSVAQPVDRILDAAGRLASSEGLPVLGEGSGLALSRAALAFERTAAALAEERARLAAKFSELEASNRRLDEAREGLLRSERLASVGRLAAGIAHEVGNPLGAIAGYAELARAKLADGSADPAAVEDFLRRIGLEAGRIDAIVRDLLDFARPTALTLTQVSVAEALEAAARLARVQQRFRDVELAVALPASLPPVLADERRLAQVFLNLLLNAGDAMAGTGRVSITARLEAGQVIVEVDDTGPGLQPEARSRVFDPFFTTKEPGQGTGLGLAVCHGIMESFGGAIEGGEAAGGGARFTLRLRMERS